jgi:two-component system LytT family response regulator
MSDGAKKIRALIVDDEPLARRTVRDLLEEDPDIEVAGECGGGLEAVARIHKQPPDLLLLDIQMPGMSGFEVLSKIDLESVPAVIFVTAYDQYALRAFEVHALDYLLKPFTDQRFREAVAQAKSQFELREVKRLSQSLRALLREQQAGRGDPAPKRKGFLTRFMIKLGSRVFFVNPVDVDWISADNYYVNLHVAGRSHLLRISMNELEEKLDPRRFWRIHRSTIINLERVKELRQNPNGDYVVVLKDGTELKLSRSRRERLEEILMSGYD